jgi:DNA-binding LacI/PurR family transcriptional regulator
MSQAAEPVSLDDVAALAPVELAAQRIREWIAAGELPAGKRLPSERALAARLSVTRAAVRSAFEALEQEGLVACSPRRARIVARRGASGATTSLMTCAILALVEKGLSGSGGARGGPSWGARLHEALTVAFTNAGLGVLFATEEQLEDRGIEQLASSPPRGLVVVHSMGNLRTREALLRALNIGEIPIVVWSDEHGWPGCDVVLSDHHGGSRSLAEWLIEHGCRRLLRVRPAGFGERDWDRRRDAGFEEAVLRAGLPLLPPLDVPGLDDDVAAHANFLRNAHLLAGYLFRALSGPEPPDAILAVSDTYVPQTAAACSILGKDPARDVTLAGYDNCWPDCPGRQWDTTAPRVTVDKDDRRIGATLAGLLLERIEGGLPAEPQRRVVGQSVVLPAPAHAPAWMRTGGEQGNVTPQS